ncbi:MAG: hypothetical protein KDC67_14980 [Ignavibacteriae bacterium]|nr:hypothetical protein [Ignavibacteriota bacterium]
MNASNKDTKFLDMTDKELKVLEFMREHKSDFDENKFFQSWKSELVSKLLKTKDEHKVLDKGMMYVTNEEIEYFRQYVDFANGEKILSDINVTECLKISDIYMKFIPKKDIENFKEKGKSIKKYLRHLKAHQELSE